MTYILDITDHAYIVLKYSGHSPQIRKTKKNKIIENQASGSWSS